jgi:hypothetical protein
VVVKELFAKLGLDLDEAGFARAEALLGGLKKGMLGLVGGLAGVGLGLLELGRETANAANDARKLAMRLGVTTDAAQELAYAAEASGSSVESLQTAMFRMSRTIDAAKHGSAAAQEALSGLGVPLTELVKMKPDEQFQALAGGLSKVTDQSKFAGKAQAIMGRNVLELVPLIKKGEEGIKAFREEAHEMGLVLSQETIADAKEWKRMVRIAGEEIEALKFKVGSFVLHGLVVMRRAWDGQRKSFEMWRNAHPDSFMNIVKGVVFGVAAAFAAWALSSGAAGTALAFVGRGVVGVISGAIRGAIALALMDASAIALGLTIFGVLAVLDDVYHWFKGDEATLIGDVIKRWKDDFHSFGDVVRSVVGTVGEATGINDRIRKQQDADDARRMALVSQGTEMRRQERRAHGEAIGQDYGVMSVAAPGQTFGAAALSPTPLLSSVPGAVSTTTNQISIYQQPGQDPRELATHVRRAIEEHERTKNAEAAAAVE